MRAIISGGGTGGHIFPAIAIANAIKERDPQAEILFVGAKGRMEMEKVPAAGYAIEGLPIAGLQRKLTVGNIIKNLLLPFKIMASRRKVRHILRSFKPDVVVGVGGFASEPTLKVAAKLGIPTVLQEQNSYAGLTNKMLSKDAKVICVAYEGMERFFPGHKLVLTGNPVRSAIEDINIDKDEALRHFGLDRRRKTVLSVGGSLGAGSINKMILDHIQIIKDNDVQLIWQTGKQMYDEAVGRVRQAEAEEWVKVHKFIADMDKAYTAADIVVSRAGAIAISELCLVGKPVILIPSPNVAEDHQTKNAMALVSKGAAIMVRDGECHDTGMSTILDLLADPTRQAMMSRTIKNMGRHNAAAHIVDEIVKAAAATYGTPQPSPTDKNQTTNAQ